MAQMRAIAHLYGSTLTKGIYSNRSDRATVRVLVEGVSNDKFGVSQAIDFAIHHLSESIIFTPVGLVPGHHAIPSLLMDDATGVRIGPDQVAVTVRYRRQFISVPTAPAESLAEVRSGFKATEWYRQPIDQQGNPAFTNGLPSGPMIFFEGLGEGDETSHPRSWVWRQPMWDVFIPTVLDSSPLSEYAHLQGKINSNPVNIGGTTFNPYTVLFVGPTQQVVETPTGVLYLITYHLQIVAVGYWKQYPVFRSPQSGGPPSWETINGLEYEAVTFPVGGLRVHS